MVASAVHYRVVYDVTQEPFAFWVLLPTFLFMALGVVMWRQHEDGGGIWGRTGFSARGRRFFAGLWFGMNTFASIVGGVSLIGNYVAAHHAMQTGSPRVVEGVVEDFHTNDRHGEQFTVGGVEFDYNDGVVDSAFTQTNAEGGPMREGLNVRIHYIGARARILKLEIRE